MATNPDFPPEYWAPVDSKGAEVVSESMGGTFIDEVDDTPPESARPCPDCPFAQGVERVGFENAFVTDAVEANGTVTVRFTQDGKESKTVRFPNVSPLTCGPEDETRAVLGAVRRVRECAARNGTLTGPRVIIAGMRLGKTVACGAFYRQTDENAVPQTKPGLRVKNTW